MYEGIVIPTALYGSEAWIWSNNVARKLNPSKPKRIYSCSKPLKLIHNITNTLNKIFRKFHRTIFLLSWFFNHGDKCHHWAELCSKSSYFVINIIIDRFLCVFLLIVAGLY